MKDEGRGNLIYLTEEIHANSSKTQTTSGEPPRGMSDSNLVAHWLIGRQEGKEVAALEFRVTQLEKEVSNQKSRIEELEKLYKFVKWIQGIFIFLKFLKDFKEIIVLGILFIGAIILLLKLW